MTHYFIFLLEVKLYKMPFKNPETLISTLYEPNIFTFPLIHLISHSQGTKKYPQTALEQQVESMGAHLSAYTSREHTAYYMKTLAKDLPKGKITCF